MWRIEVLNVVIIERLTVAKDIFLNRLSLMLSERKSLALSIYIVLKWRFQFKNIQVQ